MSTTARRVFWRATLRLTLLLLAAWLVPSLALPWFAADWNRWQGFGFPAGYWLVAQGALLTYLAIIVIYVLCMERLEARLQSAEAAPALGSGSDGDTVDGGGSSRTGGGLGGSRAGGA